MTIAEKKDAISVQLNNEISSTSSAWVKTRDTLYLTMISFANDYLLNKIANWIK